MWHNAKCSTHPSFFFFSPSLAGAQTILLVQGWCFFSSLKPQICFQGSEELLKPCCDSYMEFQRRRRKGKSHCVSKNRFKERWMETRDFPKGSGQRASLRQSFPSHNNNINNNFLSSLLGPFGRICNLRYLYSTLSHDLLCLPKSDQTGSDNKP